LFDQVGDGFGMRARRQSLETRTAFQTELHSIALFFLVSCDTDEW
jgi:hypothetical protein